MKRKENFCNNLKIDLELNTTFKLKYFSIITLLLLFMI